MTSREKILDRVKTALNSTTRAPVSPSPASARVAPRVAGDADAEIDLLLAEIAKLGGTTRRVAGRDALRAALGVEIVPSDSDRRALAECDLGVTSADAALPETGTLVLRASPGHPQMVSLPPRVHLPIVQPSALCADLYQVVDKVKGDPRAHFVTGPSRAADIEKTLTIGVHGPKALYVWVWLG